MLLCEQSATTSGYLPSASAIQTKKLCGIFPPIRRAWSILDRITKPLGFGAYRPTGRNRVESREVKRNVVLHLSISGEG